MASNSQQHRPSNYDNGPDFDQTTEMVPSGGSELAVNRDMARVIQEVQGAIIVAKRFPRSEDDARIRLIRACKRPSFAEEAEYIFPRGGSDVSGPSVALAREAARVWGNIQYGFEVIAEDGVWRAIRAWAWDVEANSKAFQEDRFKKLIYRKNKGWIEPDERDLRELTNRRAAIGYRNCILQLVPKDMVDEAVEQSRMTLRDRAAKDPDGERKRVCDAFSEINVFPNALEAILGHPLGESSPAEITELRAIYKSIRDGNSTISEYLQPKETTASKSEKNLQEIKERYAQAAPVTENPPRASTETPAEPLPPEEKAKVDARRAELKDQTQQAQSRRSQHTNRRVEPEPGVSGIFDENSSREGGK